MLSICRETSPYGGWHDSWGVSYRELYRLLEEKGLTF